VTAGNTCHNSLAHAKPPDDVQHIGKYRLIKTIGRGNFAKVKMAKHVPTGRQVMKCKLHLSASLLGHLHVLGIAYFSNLHHLLP